MLAAYYEQATWGPTGFKSYPRDYSNEGPWPSALLALPIDSNREPHGWESGV